MSEVEGWYTTLVRTVLEDGSRLPQVVHVHPTWETHALVGECWCGPEVDESERFVQVTHRDRLDRDGPADPERSS